MEPGRLAWMKQRVELSARKQVISERKWLIAAACAISVYAVTLVLESSSTLTPAPSAPVLNRPRCSKVFIDLGSNVGDSIMAFTDPFTVTAKRKGPVTALGRKYAPTLSEFCIYGFEGNPRFTGVLHSLQESLHKSVRHAEIFTETVVSDRSGGNQTLYLDDTSRKHNYSGSSLYSSHESVRKGSGARVSVPAVDFTNFLASVISPSTDVRKPGAAHDPQFGDRVVIVKMDVEGKEYDLIREMIVHGMLCNMVDYLLLEFHDKAFEGAPGAAGMTGRMQERGRVIEWLLESDKCHTKLITHGVPTEHAGEMEIQAPRKPKTLRPMKEANAEMKTGVQKLMTETSSKKYRPN